MAKEIITQAEHLQLIGLATMAQQYSERVLKVRDSIYELLGTSDEDDKQGSISDLVWADLGVPQLLEQMGITVDTEPSVHFATQGGGYALCGSKDENQLISNDPQTLTCIVCFKLKAKLTEIANA
jgi:hypothetical protein